jgi:hypothetical protein
MKDKTQEKKAHPHRSPDREANERFVHLREVDFPSRNGRVIGDVTAFIRTSRPHGGTPGVEYVSFAECDARDQFCRKTGRVVARRKWFQNKSVPLLRITAADGLLVEDATLYARVLETYYT